MQRVQRRPSYAEAVLAMKPTFYSAGHQPGGRADGPIANIDLTGRGKAIVAGTRTPGNVRLAPNCSPAWWFDGVNMWQYDSTDYVIWHPYGPWAWSFWCQPWTNADETRACPIGIAAGAGAYSNVGAMVFFQQASNTGGLEFHLAAVPDGVQNTPASSTSIYASGTIPRGKPLHISVLKLATGGSPFGKEGPAQMAINGRIIPTANNMNVDHNMYRFTVGGNTVGFWREFTGHIWDVACWAWNIPTMEQLCRLYSLGMGGSARFEVA